MVDMLPWDLAKLANFVVFKGTDGVLVCGLQCAAATGAGVTGSTEKQHNHNCVILLQESQSRG